MALVRSAARPTASCGAGNSCAPESLKEAAVAGALEPPGLELEFDDPRLLRVLGELEARGEQDVAVLVRPWLTVRREGGLPVELRAFATDGQVAVSNYHARRPLPDVYRGAAQVVQESCRELAAHCPLRSFSADFLVLDDGRVVYLEGGVGADERGLLDLCCFEAPPRGDAILLRR